MPDSAVSNADDVKINYDRVNEIYRAERTDARIYERHGKCRKKAIGRASSGMTMVRDVSKFILKCIIYECARACVCIRVPRVVCI